MRMPDIGQLLTISRNQLLNIVLFLFLLLVCLSFQVPVGEKTNCSNKVVNFMFYVQSTLWTKVMFSEGTLKILFLFRFN